MTMISNIQQLPDIKKFDFSKIKIAVVGDVMLDQYWQGETTRISPEAPVPVVQVKNIDHRPGGAGNVAVNLAALGCKVSLFGLTGDDAAAETLNKILTEKKVEHYLLNINNHKTITKLRILSKHQQLIRLDQENDFSKIDNNRLINAVKKELINCQALILSDYAKGTLYDPAPFIKIAKNLGIPVIIDPKKNDFTVYNGATVITPNLKEFENIVGFCADTNIMLEKANNLIAQHDIESIIITQGEQGLTVISKNNKKPLHIPAHSAEVFDVTGAGDTVVAVLTAFLSCGIDITVSAKMATIAAGIVVGKVGTSCVSITELMHAVGQEYDLSIGIITEQKLKDIIKLCQSRGEKIVFTNGCYDILHYGHIRYLEQAKALGDRLVVGVNSDDSVKRLKGKNRPVNNLAQRMEVLAGLKAVDWVVEFTEDTPGRLVESLSPDILAKGNEHFKTIAEIPAQAEGINHVLNKGGTVHLIPRIAGVSSSDIIKNSAN